MTSQQEYGKEALRLLLCLVMKMHLIQGIISIESDVFLLPTADSFGMPGDDGIHLSSVSSSFKKLRAHNQRFLMEEFIETT